MRSLAFLKQNHTCLRITLFFLAQRLRYLFLEVEGLLLSCSPKEKNPVTFNSINPLVDSNTTETTFYMLLVYSSGVFRGGTNGTVPPTGSKKVYEFC